MPVGQRSLSRRDLLGAAAGGLALSLLPIRSGAAAAGSRAPAARAASLACWGDSLTYGVGGAGVTYPDLLGNQLGRSTYNGGVIGERSSGVATRQGGRRPDVRVPAPTGQALPPNTFKVNVDQASPWWARAMVIQEEGTLPGALAGVHGVLNKQGNYRDEFSPYYFTRDQGTERPRAGQFTADIGVEYAGVDQIIWCGHNDLRLVDAPNVPPSAGRKAQALVTDNVALMVDYARATGARYFVLSVLNGKGAGNGSTTTGRPTEYYRNVVLSLNPTLAATYGPEHYLDIRTWLVRDALAYAGILPTEKDRRDMEEDIPPSSLTVPGGEDPHLNQQGYELVAAYLAERLLELGW